MSVQNLTAAAVRNLAPVEGKQIEILDQKSRGLGIRVNPGGTRTWFLIYKANGRQRRHTIGRYPTLSLADARAEADRLRLEIANGGDPSREKAALRDGAFAYQDFVDHFIETYAKPRNRAWEENARILKRDFARTWRGRDIREISKSDVVAAIDKISQTGGPSAANHAFAHVRRLFNWAVERGSLETSPCQGLRQPNRARSRDRVLTDSELKNIWLASEELGYPYGTFIQLLILTGQRRDEVASMRWKEVDLSDRLWTIPRERTKADRVHAIPLTPQAIALIESLPRIHNEFVFPARGRDVPISGFSKWKKQFDQRSGVSGWRVHDVRRTVASGMAKRKVQPHVIERVQNRLSGTLGGVAGVYNRYDYIDEMREALTLWAEHVEQLAQSATVVADRRRRVPATRPTGNIGLI